MIHVARMEGDRRERVDVREGPAPGEGSLERGIADQEGAHRGPVGRLIVAREQPLGPEVLLPQRVGDIGGIEGPRLGGGEPQIVDAVGVGERVLVVQRAPRLDVRAAVIERIGGGVHPGIRGVGHQDGKAAVGDAPAQLPLQASCPEQGTVVLESAEDVRRRLNEGGIRGRH